MKKGQGDKRLDHARSLQRRALIDTDQCRPGGKIVDQPRGPFVTTNDPLSPQGLDVVVDLPLQFTISRSRYRLRRTEYERETSEENN